MSLFLGVGWLSKLLLGNITDFFFFSDFKCLDQSGAAEALSPAQRGNDKD